MKTKILSIVFALGIIASSCVSELVVDDKVANDINNLVVPAGFDWSTARDVSFNVTISDIRFKNSLHVVAVYTADPSTGVAKALSKGTASLASSFKTKISIPAGVKEVYFVKTAPDGTKYTQKVALTATSSLAVALGATPSGRLSANTELYATTETSPDCNTGCDMSVSSSTTIDLDSKTGSQTICLTGSDYTVNFNPNTLNGGTLRICGTNITLNNLNFNSGAKYTVIITSKGSANFSNVNWNSADVTVKNFGTLNSSGNLIVGGTFYNYGVVNANSELQSRSGSNIINEGQIIVKGASPLDGAMTNNAEISFAGEVRLNSSGQTVTNNGTMTAAGNFIINNSTTMTNNSYMTVADMQVNSSGILNNKCHLIIKNTLGIDKTVNNDSYISVGSWTRINGSGVVNLYNGALFVTNSLSTYDGKITGTGDNYSLFKVLTAAGGNINNGGGQKLTGTVQFSEPSDILKADFLDKFAQKTKDGGIYIAKTSCNEGNGTAPVSSNDSDKDGVIDSEDAYPNDPAKAFNNYNVPSTVAFEDQWPSVGDYDLNDVILAFTYTIVTSSTNQVVQVKADYTLQATGGSFNNGAGIQFNIPTGNAKNFTGTSTIGAGLEAGQDSVVVILFNNARNEQSAWNTRPNEPVVAYKTYSFSFDVTNGPSIGAFGLGSYNPFIFNNTSGFGRGYETHLYGKNPTKLVNKALFGTKDDASTGSAYYATSKKLPWGIEISTANFKYPKEGVKITDTYLKFANWASSGGTSSIDWYSNTADGYRNVSNIFNP
ncbi:MULTISPECIES: LruC domain-containing protein [unclassified Arcicella]|uniref:LruC domain-containing protein n=1 Tax=unclassified Arcicella TaxID=2644986 RepID=UPI002864F03F|nr:MULTISPECIES: LruC domain-containing protein [unclassified Arcicella]MDR6563073.1 LruC domain-containing protein [Arcicella sp. BE51]MDR6813157.1 LruC domain-containing protein [Arcicella sp. BE140]MDR6824471.1 LruC domain-containing protein [Arcicella sp. BE139]